jgi:hypothetical protein
MNINVQKLESLVDDLKQILRDGLLATDFWDFSTGLSLAGFNPQPAAVALFTEVTNHLTNALADSGFPKLNRYYLLDMDADHTVLIIRHGNDLLQGLLMNNKKVNMGILLSIAMPKMVEGVIKARTAP